MTGHRRRAGRPSKAVERAVRRRQFHLERIETASDPLHRAAALSDFLRRMLVLASPVAAERAVREVQGTVMRVIADLEAREEAS